MMILRILASVLVARKIWKMVQRERDFRKLKEYGSQLGFQYIAGESIEEYRARLMELRDQEMTK